MSSSKVCRKCSTEKPITEFYRDKRGKDGYRNDCKSCNDAKRPSYPHNRDIENNRAWNRKRYEKKRKADPRHRAMILRNGAERRATAKGLEFDLDTDWIHQKILAGRCEVTGIPFKLDYEYSEKGFGTQQAFSPSLDRCDPKKGYTKENTKVVVWIYNAAKGVGTHADVVTLAEALC